MLFQITEEVIIGDSLHLLHIIVSLPEVGHGTPGRRIVSRRLQAHKLIGAELTDNLLEPLPILQMGCPHYLTKQLQYFPGLWIQHLGLCLQAHTEFFAVPALIGSCREGCPPGMEKDLIAKLQLIVRICVHKAQQIRQKDKIRRILFQVQDIEGEPDVADPVGENIMMQRRKPRHRPLFISKFPCLPGDILSGKHWDTFQFLRIIRLFLISL